MVCPADFLSPSQLAPASSAVECLACDADISVSVSAVSCSKNLLRYIGGILRNDFNASDSQGSN